MIDKLLWWWAAMGDLEIEDEDEDKEADGF